MRPISKPREFYLGISVALFLVIPTVLLSIYVFRQLEISTQSKSETQSVLRDANRLLSSLKDAEIGQRGFLLTGDTTFLAPYTEAVVNIPIDLAKLARVREGSPTGLLVEELKPLIDSKLLEISRVLALFREGETERALTALRSGTGKAPMDRIRMRVGQFVDFQTVHLSDLDRQLNIDLKRMFLVIIAAGTAWMLFLLGFISLLYRQFEGRVSAKVESETHLGTLSLLKAQTESLEKQQATNLALNASELNLHNGVAVAGLGLGVIDYVKNTISLDTAASVLFDLPEGKPLPRSAVHARFHPQDVAAVLAKMAEALEPNGLGFMAIEHRIVTGDGTVRWLSARKQVVFATGVAGDSGPLSGALAVRDITAMKSSVRELAQAKEVAESANLAKSRFLSNMSHELRTPLNAILGFAQLMASGTPSPSEKQQRSIDQILQAGWYLLELINEVLDLALIESGKLTLSSELSDFASILRECQEMMEPQGKSRDVLLVFRAPESHYLLKADRTRLKQVLLNLLSNAIKYNRKGGTVVVSCGAKDDNTLRISVADTGQGLSPENLQQLFQPFNRLGQEAFSEQGTGIGLVLSKRLIELMGGSIGAESTVGIGSLFWIDIGFDVPAPALLQGPLFASSPILSPLMNSFKEAP